jgi:broad specificity phosphatase PhoE
MVKVMLVRHGETDWNREEVFRGRIDVELNDNGREQARALAEAARIFHIDAVYSSPLSRSLETARIIAEAHNRQGCLSHCLDVKIAHGFIDFHYGDWQGLKHQEVKEKFPDLYMKWHNSPHMVQIPGGESLDNVRQRSLKELENIAAEHESQTVMIVSHRVVNKVLLCAIMGLDNSRFWRIRQSNCCLNIFECSEGEYTICLLNDISHLRQTTGSILEADF